MIHDTKNISISALSKRCGVAPPNIRYYEKIALLPEPDRSRAGQRCYGQQDVDRLTFIRRCRDFGFSIAQVRALLALPESPSNGCNMYRDIATDHANQIDQKIGELKALQRSLRGLIASCETQCPDNKAQDCKVFVALQGETASPPALK